MLLYVLCCSCGCIVSTVLLSIYCCLWTKSVVTVVVLCRLFCFKENCYQQCGHFPFYLKDRYCQFQRTDSNSYNMSSWCELIDIFQYQSYLPSDNMLIIPKSNINTEIWYIYRFRYLYFRWKITYFKIFTRTHSFRQNNLQNIVPK